MSTLFLKGFYIVASAAVFIIGISKCGGCITDIDPNTSDSPGDINHFIVNNNYEAIHSFVGEDSWLLAIKATCVDSDGTLNMYDICGDSSPKVRYSFIRKYREPPKSDVGYLYPLIEEWYKNKEKEKSMQQAQAGSGKIGSGTRVVYEGEKKAKSERIPYQMAEVTIQKPYIKKSVYFRSMHLSLEDRASFHRGSEDPKPLPSFTMKQIWEIAIREEAPSNALADIEYSNGRYKFEIKERIQKVDSDGNVRFETTPVFFMELNSKGEVKTKKKY
jgi:hypothetical protein